VRELAGIGLTVVFLGVVVLFFGDRARGYLRIKLSDFDCPVWSLLIVFGILIMTLDMAISAQPQVKWLKE
jgi:uncharacterized membrane protein